MNQQQNSFKGDPFFVPKMLWGAMLASQFMFVFVLSSEYPFQWVGVEAALTDTQSSAFLFSIMAVLNLALASFLPAYLYKSAIKRMMPPTDDVDLTKRVFLPFIIRLAFAESITLMGFVAGASVKNSATILPFLLASIAIFLLNIPTRNYFRSWVRR